MKEVEDVAKQKEGANGGLDTVLPANAKIMVSAGNLSGGILIEVQVAT